MSAARSPRTQEEILDRFREHVGEFFHFQPEVLAEAMDATTLATATGSSAPNGWAPKSFAELEADARAYLTFAVEKIEDHRGLSAERSVQKLTEYAWLLGRDDVVKAMDVAGYPQYGAPKVKAFAVGMGWDWPKNDELEQMADGDPCEPGCESGCGQ